MTIQSSTAAARPFLDSRSDTRRLIAQLQVNADAQGLLDFAPALQLTTIVVRPTVSARPSRRDLTATELAERIIDGIRDEQQVLELHERRGRLEYLVDLLWR